ncbi:MAG: response regulator [Deltaproteobacteria bacterium]|nr:response regulator [Deltaproteobacteria bacterium]
MIIEGEVQTHYTPRILVVDDKARIREACKSVLEECGYEVSLASNGLEALASIPAEHYDIILLDLMMPEMSGFEVLAKVKSLDPDTVVIVITGYATLEHSVDAMKKGAFDFIPKPFTPDHLRVTVAKAIEYTRALWDIADTRSRLRTMVNHISDGVMCTNHQNKVALANPAFLRMIGCQASSMIGRGVEEFINIPRIREMISQSLNMPESEFSELTEEITLNGQNRPEELVLSIRCAPFRARNGRNLGVITVLHDITALKRMDRMKSQFVSTVSHEIQSPMNSVMMQIQVILDGLAGDLTEKQRSILTRASQKINNLARMASELLDLARIESGLISLEREPVDMSAIIRDQVAFHLPKAESESIRLEIDVPEMLPPILANRRNMEEVLSNLITNAIKYSPDGGQVLVSAFAENDSLCIRVKDRGLGISPEDLKLIFKQFYRIKNEKTRYINGTGLGLAIVKSILESHQGRIKVESQPGEGSTFIVFLPVLPA